MSKLVTTASTRLICFGSARLSTNDTDHGEQAEDVQFPLIRYDP